MSAPPESEADRYEKELNGKAARLRLYRVLPVFVAAVAILGWRVHRLYDRFSEPPPPADVRVLVKDDGVVFEGKSYTKTQVGDLARAISSAHTGASVTLCAPSGSEWIGLLTYQSFHTNPGFQVGTVEPSHALCAP